MARSYMLRVALTDIEKSKLQAFADNRQISLSEAVRDFVKSLPSPKTEDAK